MKNDQGYKNLSPQTISFDDAQDMARKVWDAYGATAFSSPSGNMICELVNMAAAKATQPDPHHCGQDAGEAQS